MINKRKKRKIRVNNGYLEQIKKSELVRAVDFNSPPDTPEENDLREGDNDLREGDPFESWSTVYEPEMEDISPEKYPEPFPKKDLSIYLKHENRDIAAKNETKLTKIVSNNQLIHLLAEAVHYINENDQSHLSTYIKKAEIYRDLDEIRFHFLMDIYLYTLGPHFYEKKQTWNYRYHIHKGEVLKKNQQTLNYKYLTNKLEKPGNDSMGYPMTLEQEFHLKEYTAQMNKLFPKRRQDFKGFINVIQKNHPSIPPLFDEFYKELWDWKIAFKREDPMRFIFMSPYLERFEKLFPNFRDKVRIREEYRSRELADSQDPEYNNYKNEEEFIDPGFWEGFVISFRRPGEDTIKVRLFKIKVLDPDEREEFVPAIIEIPIEYVDNLGPLSPNEIAQLGRFELNDYYNNLNNQDPYVL